MDDGLLIEEVEKFKHIYDKRSSLFKSKLARENAWKTIGKILGAEGIYSRYYMHFDVNFDSFISAGECEQRWNVLRNKYVSLKRQIGRTPSGSQAFTISWPYYESMKFLDPFTLTRVKR